MAISQMNDNLDGKEPFKNVRLNVAVMVIEETCILNTSSCRMYAVSS